MVNSLLYLFILIFSFKKYIFFQVNYNYFYFNEEYSVTIYNNSRLNEYFKYDKKYQNLCDCSIIDIFSLNETLNNVTFIIRNNSNEFNEYDNLFSIVNISNDNKNLIKLSYNVSKYEEKIYVNIYHQCLNYDNFSKNWGITNLNIANQTNISFIKYCNMPTKKYYISFFSHIFSTIISFIIATLFLIISTNSEMKIVFSNQSSDGEINTISSIILVLTGSTILIITFFFGNYHLFQIILSIIILNQILFSITISMESIYLKKEIYKYKYLSFLQFIIYKSKSKNKEYHLYQLLIFLIVFILIILYIITKHWILNNIMIFFLCYTILLIYRIRSYRICLIFLVMTFLYDVFWVYISPYIFKGNNVMAYVATSINLPIKLEIPYFFIKNPIRKCVILGLGDIIIPGFTIKFFKRFDFIQNSNIYYNLGIKMYILAISLSGFSALFFNYPQPVLFYMGPILLISSILVAYKRGEIYNIWNSDKIEDNLTINELKNRFKYLNIDINQLNKENNKIEFPNNIELNNIENYDINSNKDYEQIIKNIINDDDENNSDSNENEEYEEYESNHKITKSIELEENNQ